MIINQIIGNLSENSSDKTIDYLDLEWFETTKRIQRKKTRKGTDIAIKFLREGQRLREGDILFEDAEKIIAINVLETEAIVMSPASLLEMGTVCYEIGNKHIPLFIQNDKVLLPFEMPMFRWLEASGFRPEKQSAKLLNLLKSNVEPHGHGSLGSTIFTKILKMAAPKDE
ncbi:urease accessory protein UreE [Chryseobacterium culicis]|uniref:Urease accessory protein UreE n=1 Tax=Chryseobacterium culicis TaxID=680127 RepID=A0A2S9D0B5_CHRCI|nr:urease accessory protein UreE [Chryseobacterium culicis]PRB86217.1 urease accessory protein UreE [Chryseobacterium culicis]PRB91970.1 urease accessory protein UreE [Chryseobacterium culicis]